MECERLQRVLRFININAAIWAVGEGFFTASKLHGDKSDLQFDEIIRVASAIIQSGQTKIFIIAIVMIDFIEKTHLTCLCQSSIHENEHWIIYVNYDHFSQELQMQKLLQISTMVLFLTLTLSVSAFAYQYITAAEVKQHIAEHTPMTLVDIQVEDEFHQHHIIGAQATYAYPVETADERAKMMPVITPLLSNNDLAVVVCPRGGGGAKRAYDLLLQSGVAENRVYILKKGQAAWPYPELLDPSH
jgi:rhodanese-related sulfurtransferase